MGEWAHPDDDTSIIGPCGVWRQRFEVKCGLIMVTRGEGGGNAVAQEIGPALGLRRENEDRVAHFRSGTVDIFNLDRVDFFYNTSAPLTQFFWGQDETLRRITRIIRMTQPEIYIGFTPTLNAGHGNHQQAGRYIWEGVLAAADPTMFPEQLEGPGALSTWQVKKVFSGGSTAGSGGTRRARLHQGLHAGRLQSRRRGRRLARRGLALQVAGGQRAGPAGRHGQELGPGPPRGQCGVPDAEPHDVPGHRAGELLALRHDAVVRPVPAERRPRRPATTTRSCTAPRGPTRAGFPWARSST